MMAGTRKILYTHPSYGAKELTTSADRVVVGRPKPGLETDLDLTPDMQVSHHHACITYESGECWIEDLSSKRGTWVNETKIERKTRLGPGDKVRLGQTTLEVQVETIPAEAQAQALAEAVAEQPASPEAEEPLPEGVLTSTIGMGESPSNLLLAEKPGEASLEAARRRLSAFCELAVALGAAADLPSALKTVVEHLCKAIPGAQRGGVLLREGEDLLLKAHVPADKSGSASLSLARRAIENREAFTWRIGTPGDMAEVSRSVFWHGTLSKV